MKTLLAHGKEVHKSAYPVREDNHDNPNNLVVSDKSAICRTVDKHPNPEPLRHEKETEHQHGKQHH